MEKVGCACALQSSFLVLLWLLHLHKVCPIGPEIKKWPPFKAQPSNSHQFTCFPSSQQKARALWQGLCSIFPHWGVKVQEVQTSSSPTVQQCSLKPELAHDFTPLMDAAIWSIISHKSSELCLASAMQKAMQSSPEKGHRLAPTSRGKVLPPPLGPSHTGPVRPDSLENFNLLHWVLLLPLKSFITLELGSLMHLTCFTGKSMSSLLQPHSLKCFKVTWILQKSLVNPMLSYFRMLTWSPAPVADTTVSFLNETLNLNESENLGRKWETPVMFTFAGSGHWGMHLVIGKKVISAPATVQKGLEMPRGPRLPLMLSIMHSADAMDDCLQACFFFPYCATFTRGLILANLHRAVVTAIKTQSVQLPHSHQEPQALVPTSYRVHT